MHKVDIVVAMQLSIIFGIMDVVDADQQLTIERGQKPHKNTDYYGQTVRHFRA